MTKGKQDEERRHAETFTLGESVTDRLRRVSKKLGVPMSRIVEAALVRHLTSLEKK